MFAKLLLKFNNSFAEMGLTSLSKAVIEVLVITLKLKGRSVTVLSFMEALKGFQCFRHLHWW